MMKLSRCMNVLALGCMIAGAQAALPVLTYGGATGYLNPYTLEGAGEPTTFTVGSLVHVDPNAAFGAIASLGGPAAQAYVDTAGWQITHQNNQGAKSSAAVYFDFLVSSGVTLGDYVPITITGYALFNSGGDGSASGYARVARAPGTSNLGGLSFQQFTWGCGNGGSDCGHVIPFTMNATIYAFGTNDPGEVGRMSLLARAEIVNNAQFATQVSAYVDPVITIDPAYLATHPGAQLLVNPAVTNAANLPAVPEPQSAALLLAGLLAVGARLRRRSGPATTRH